MRSVKELIKRTTAFEQEINHLEKKITEIMERSQTIIKNGHYKSEEIISITDALVERFNLLHEPLANRRTLLEESLKCHQLSFDADVELQWIDEKRLIVESKILGRGLTESLNMLKKHDHVNAELTTHEPKVNAILESGNNLIDAKHTFAKSIKEKCNEVFF